MKRVAIVILNWNGRKMLEEFLPSVITCSREEADVFVADNASTDDSVEYLRQHYASEVQLILMDKNWGFAEGYNRALSQIDAEYFVLLNSDVEVTPCWLTPLILFMDAHQDVAACQPKLLSVANKKLFEYAGASGGFMDRYGYPFCRGRLFDTLEEDNGQYDSPQEIFWATGACLFIRAREYNNVGGFDARFFAHNEEIDLCWRLQLFGRKIYCIPESVIYHLGGGTLPKANPMKTFLNFRNNLTMLYKNLPEKDLQHVMRWRWFLDYLAAWKMLVVNQNIGEFKAVYRARRAYKKWKKDFESDRQRIQQSRVEDVINVRYPHSILWQYYIKGKKRFKDLPAK